MFGYIVINKPEMKIKHFDTYQHYYCGLCKCLKNNHGQLSRLTLNYDLHFVGLLLTGLYEPNESIGKMFCPLHPLHKKTYITNPMFDYASDMNIVLTYYKFEDDILDDASTKSKVLKTLLQKQFNNVQKKYPEKVKKIHDYLEKIHELEKNNCQDLDDISGCFGYIMGEILSYQDDIFKEDLYQMGFFLGKYIYLIDAYEDIEKDIKNHSYNPFIKDYQREDFNEYCYHILEMMMVSSSEYFEKLPIFEHIDTLRNIIYSGIWTKFELIKKKRMEEKQ